MADNPFYVAPPNILQALMLGTQSYDTSRKRAEEQAQMDAIRAAAPDLAAGNYGAALGKVGASGSPSVLFQLAQLASTDAQRKQAQANADRSYNLDVRRLNEKQPHYTSDTDPLTGTTSVFAINPDGTARRITLPPAPAPPSPQPTQPTQTSNTVPYTAESPVPMANQGIPGAQPIQQAQASPVPAALPPGNPNRERDEAYLQTLPANTQALVKRLADYDLNPAQLSKFKGHAEAVLGAVARYDPTYDVKNYAMRSQTINAFAKGPPGNAVRSFSVALDHLDTLDSLAKALHNSDFPAFNAIKNKVQTQIGIEAPGNFDAAKRVIGGEIVKAVIGAAGALGDREEAIRAIDSAKSYPQLKGVIDTYQKLMAGQLQGYQRQYEEGTGRKNFDSLLSEPAKRLLRGGEPTKAEPTKGAGGTTKSGVRWQVLD